MLSIHNNHLSESVCRMAREISDLLNQPLHGFWLYGSVVFDDFRAGWSDVDFIAFTRDPIEKEQAERLLNLRQALTERFPENPYYRCFEGIIVNLGEYETGVFTRLIYWGTSGQRITDRCRLDAFSRFELAGYGVSVCGDGDRSIFVLPERQELGSAVREHCDQIRRCAVQTDESLYSCGWLLDIARCIYTLRHNDVIAKTSAGEWALSEHLFPDEAPLVKTLEIRRNPLKYANDPDIRNWLKSLGPTVQQYADVLDRELAK